MVARSGKILEIASSPHIRSGASVDKIMRHVVYALLPASAFAVYVFGLAALITLAAAVVSCLLAEYLFCRLNGRASTLGDWSIAVTGLLYGLTLPPGLPIWMVVLGGVVAVGVGKILFGGLGYNAFNPALVGRAFLQAAFPVAMTTWYPSLGADRFTSVPSSLLAFPFSTPSYDATTGATPLSAMKFDGNLTDTTELVMGLTTGSTGETSALLLLAGGAYLVARNFMNWRIPVAILGTVFVMRSTVFRRPNEAGYGQDEAWGFVALTVGGLWIASMLVSVLAPTITISDDIIIPVGAIVAPIVAAALTPYACEFLIEGMAARIGPRGT